MLPSHRRRVLGKIAGELRDALTIRARNGAEGGLSGRPLARGHGWRVTDVVCTSGPSDRAFDEEHSATSVSIVLAGTFQYRSALGTAVMTPGSMMLGNVGACFVCSHEHAAGDRCVSFHFDDAWLERLASDAGFPRTSRTFRTPRIPTMRDSAAAVTSALVGLTSPAEHPWEEVAIEVAATAVHLASGFPVVRTNAPHRTIARVTDAVREIERHPAHAWSLGELAARADQSPFQYLRAFKQVTGTTPHQFVLRARLRDAAIRLVAEDRNVSDIAFDSGFGDISNFNRAFRTEFGAAPEGYRAQLRGAVRRDG
jgi:AraC family transcriptional regulator